MQNKLLTLKDIPEDVYQTNIFQFFTVRDIANLYSVSKEHQQRMITNWVIIKEQLLRLGIPENALQEKNLKQLTNYWKLYSTCRHIRSLFGGKMFLDYVNHWQKLLYLSGDKKEVSRSLELQQKCFNSDYGIKIIHLITLSGEPDILDMAVTDYKLDINAFDTLERGVEHYAAMTTHPSQLKKAIALGCKLHYYDQNGMGIVLHAALSGSPEQLEFVQELRLDLSANDDSGMNIKHHAAMSYNPQQQEKANELELKLQLKLNTFDGSKMSPAHYCAMSAFPNQLDNAVKLGLDLEKLDDADMSPGDYAIDSGSLQQVEKAQALGLKFNKIPSYYKDLYPEHQHEKIQKIIELNNISSSVTAHSIKC